jgi:hypothetical protein
MEGMRLQKPTGVFRATLKREIACILPPDVDGCTRRVTVLVPAGEIAYIAPDVTVMQVASNETVPAEGLDYDPDGIGPNESYRLPVWPSGLPVFIWLTPEQSLYGASHHGLVFASLVVEHWK